MQMLCVVGQVQSGLGAHSVAAGQTFDHVLVPIAESQPQSGMPDWRCIAVYSSVYLDNGGLSWLQ
jgi:hypothetical protein